MPPIKQITKEAVLAKAMEMTRRDGFDAITARALAASLHCSTQPIYQSFADMKALEKEVSAQGFGYMLEVLRQEKACALPVDLSIVLQYIHFALQERHLFQLIARNGCFQPQANERVPGMPTFDPKLLIFANGIVFMSFFQSLDLSWDQIQNITIEAYGALCGGQEK